MTTAQNGNNLIVQGRIVWSVGSSLFEGKQKTDYNTNQPVIGADGNPKMQYGFGLAIPKIDPNTGQNHAEYVKIYQALHGEALTLYPGGQLPPGFALKYKDGDGVDHNGKPFADREGYAGHIVVSCTTEIPIKWFVYEGGNNVLTNQGIKVGDYVEVQLNIKAHPAKGQGKAGLYVNPLAARLITPGKEIINAPSGDQIFGTQQSTYAGQVVAPEVGGMPMQQPQAPVAAPGMPQQPAAAPQVPAGQPAMPQTPQAPQAAPAMPQAPAAPSAPQPVAAPGMPMQQPQAPQAAPHYGVLPPGHQPQ